MSHAPSLRHPSPETPITLPSADLPTAAQPELELVLRQLLPDHQAHPATVAGFYPVFVMILLSGMIWLETLLAQACGGSRRT
jgi:hypothetical protein